LMISKTSCAMRSLNKPKNWAIPIVLGTNYMPSSCLTTTGHEHNSCRTCAASRRSPSTLNVCVSGKYRETRSSCLFIIGKNRMGVAT
jgi:hypothetical protein